MLQPGLGGNNIFLGMSRPGLAKNEAKIIFYFNFFTIF